MAKRTRWQRGGALAVTLAFALLGASKHDRWIICLFCAAIAASLAYSFWGWVSRRSLSVVEKLARRTILVVGCFAASFAYGYYFWPPADITVQPSRFTFSASDPKWLGDTCTFAFTNNTNEDRQHKRSFAYQLA